MPVKCKKDSKGGYAQFGSGKKYRYKMGDKESRERAKKKAEKQGSAMYAGGYKGK